jgi:hypothetical protein
MNQSVHYQPYDDEPPSCGRDYAIVSTGLEWAVTCKPCLKILKKEAAAAQAAEALADKELARREKAFAKELAERINTVQKDIATARHMDSTYGGMEVDDQDEAIIRCWSIAVETGSLKLAELELELIRVRDGVLRSGKHLDDCDLWQTPNSCTCGLAKLHDGRWK